MEKELIYNIIDVATIAITDTNLYTEVIFYILMDLLRGEEIVVNRDTGIAYKIENIDGVEGEFVDFWEFIDRDGWDSISDY